MKIWPFITVGGFGAAALAAYLVFFGASGGSGRQAEVASEPICTSCTARHKAYRQMKVRLGDEIPAPAGPDTH